MERATTLVNLTMILTALTDSISSPSNDLIDPLFQAPDCPLVGTDQGEELACGQIGHGTKQLTYSSRNDNLHILDPTAVPATGHVARCCSWAGCCCLAAHATGSCRLVLVPRSGLIAERAARAQRLEKRFSVALQLAIPDAGDRAHFLQCRGGAAPAARARLRRGKIT
jgi:hypothetical protein